LGKRNKIILLVMVVLIFGGIIYIYTISPEEKKLIKRKVRIQKREMNYKREVKKLSKEYVEPIAEKIKETKSKVEKEKEIIKKYFDVLNGKTKGDIYAYMKTIENIGKELKTDEEKKLVYPALIDINIRNDRFDEVERLEKELEKMGVNVKKFNEGKKGGENENEK